MRAIAARVCTPDEHSAIKADRYRLLAETEHLGYMTDDGRPVLALRNCIRINPGCTEPCGSTIGIEVAP